MICPFGIFLLKNLHVSAMIVKSAGDHMNAEFSGIINSLQNREEAVLSRTVAGVAYCRRFVPKDRLIILGGGHISEALVKIAVTLDFSVTVVDDRYDFANPARFSEADEVICEQFEDAIDRLRICERDYICVLTRGHQFDKECVKKILSGTMPFYLGMIGSEKKVAGVLESLKGEGFSNEKISKINAPIGLPIGSVTVPEIAVSICAQLIACRRAFKQPYDDNTLIQTEENSDVLSFLANGDRPRAMAMILSATGSTPAKSGALMAVDADGRLYGTIGGGCGEAQAKRAAMRLIGSGKSKILTIDMDNDAAAKGGMVCGGRIEVLIEDIRED